MKCFWLFCCLEPSHFVCLCFSRASACFLHLRHKHVPKCSKSQLIACLKLKDKNNAQLIGGKLSVGEWVPLITLRAQNTCQACVPGKKIQPVTLRGGARHNLSAEQSVQTIKFFTILNTAIVAQTAFSTRIFSTEPCIMGTMRTNTLIDKGLNKETRFWLLKEKSKL